MLADAREFEGDFLSDYPLVARHLAERYREAGTIDVDEEPRLRVFVDAQRAAGATGSPLRTAVLPVTRAAPGAAVGPPRGRRVVAARRASSIERQLASLRGKDGPIVAGPWLGEVGFELLYWIPFLRWFVERFGVSRDRLIAVSRGGSAAAWYGSFAGRSHDALSFMALDEFKRKNEDRSGRLGEQKQIAANRARRGDHLRSSVRRRASGCRCCTRRSCTACLRRTGGDTNRSSGCGSTRATACSRRRR